jgi:hypothetical protein
MTIVTPDSELLDTHSPTLSNKALSPLISEVLATFGKAMRRHVYLHVLFFCLLPLSSWL